MCYNVRSQSDSEELELSFYVHLKDEDQNDALVLALRRLEGMRGVDLFFDEEYT